MGQLIQFTKKPDPVTAHNFYIHGCALEDDAGKISEAIEAYQHAIDCDPRMPEPYINLGTIYYNRKNFEEAEKLYRKATELAPNHALAWFNLGNTLDELSKPHPAIYAYERALAINPNYSDAHFNLALLLEKQNEKIEALKHWTAYQKSGKNDKWTRSARQHANKLKKDLGFVDVNAPSKIEISRRIEVVLVEPNGRESLRTPNSSLVPKNELS